MHCEQRCRIKIPATIELGVVLDHPHDASQRDHLLPNPLLHDANDMMTAATRSVIMARITWLGPIPGHLNALE